MDWSFEIMHLYPVCLSPSPRTTHPCLVSPLQHTQTQSFKSMCWSGGTAKKYKNYQLFCINIGALFSQNMQYVFIVLFAIKHFFQFWHLKNLAKSFVDSLKTMCHKSGVNWKLTAQSRSPVHLNILQIKSFSFSFFHCFTIIVFTYLFQRDRSARLHHRKQ